MEKCKNKNCSEYGREVYPIYNSKTFKNGTIHIEATAPCCDGFIKWMPQGKDPVFYFGKYKGMTIAEVVKLDLGYVHWIYGETKDSKLKEQINQVLQI
jgi:hypothetical protein